MPRAMLAALAIACLVFTACDDDPAEPKKVTPSAYQDLTQEWHVLNNLAEAYDDKNVTRFEELLDAASFVFYFDPGDVGGQLNIPTQWDYAAELQSATNMFTGEPGLNDNPILTIDLFLFDIENVAWSDVSAHPDFPGETLREAVVRYDYFIDTTKDLQHITAGEPVARLIVRNVGGTWKIARWYDQPGGALLRAGASTEESTWGQVKALYR